jgi:hypothetical protein
MKTKNQTGHELLELAVAKAANEDGFTAARTSDADRKQAWCPAEVWRTRVKATSRRSRNEPAQV